MVDRDRIVSNVLGLVGGAVGGIVGFYLFGWIVRQGFYALIIPGAALGFGCAMLARHASTARGVVCGLAGAALGLLAEATYFPFRVDSQLSYFFAHLGELRPMTWILVAVGGLIAFWVGKDAGYGGVGLGRKPGPPPEA